MKRKPWVKSRSSHSVSRITGIAETALQGMGGKEWSPAHKAFMPPSSIKKIDPKSPEGRAIEEKYNVSHQKRD